MTLSTAFEWVDLPLDTTFAISRGATETSANVIVRITDETGTVGLGGAAPSEYYGETRETVAERLPAFLDAVADVGDPHALQRIGNRVREIAGGERSAPAARSAVDVALHDLVGKRLDLPLYRYWGLDPSVAPRSSYTIGLADPATMADRAAAAVADGYSVLKVKVGTDRDRAIVRAVREAAPDARIRVDANGGWDADTAIEMTDVLAEHDVEFVEQPVAGDDLDGLARVAAEGSVPVAADESCVTAADVPRVADAVDLVVVKLSKCGGLRPAIRQIHAAQAHGLDVMLGCMTESNASIAAAVHLTPLVSHVDLDGALLLADNRFAGVPERGGDFDLAGLDRPGTGAVEH